MKQESYFTCDLCGRKFPTKSGVRNDVAIMDGKPKGIFQDVCEDCPITLRELINEKFPKNTNK